MGMYEADQKKAAGAIAQRYGEGQVWGGSEWNDTLALLLAHRSVRSYLDTPLADGALESIIAAAQSASTSSNLQMWSVVAVEQPARKQRLAALAGNQQHIERAPLFLVFVADHARLRRAAAMSDTAAEGLDYLETFLVGMIDAALAAQNAVVAAESLGLGTVYIGGMRNHPEEVAAVLELPPHVMAAFGVCVGYPDPDRPAQVKPRLPQAAVLHRETYRADDDSDDLTSYNAVLRVFQARAGMAEADWTRFATKRVSGAASLNGRDRLRDAAASLGFEAR